MDFWRMNAIAFICVNGLSLMNVFILLPHGFSCFFFFLHATVLKLLATALAHLADDKREEDPLDVVSGPEHNTNVISEKKLVFPDKRASTSPRAH